MRRVGWVLAAGGVAAALVTGLGVAAQPDAVRDGQLVFVPVEAEPAGAGPAIRIASCQQTDEGLRVEGWAPPVDAGQQAVAVTPARETGAGVQVGAGYATRSGLVPGSPVGSFLVTLPWAQAVGSQFVLVANETAGGRVALGPVVTCP